MAVISIVILWDGNFDFVSRLSPNTTPVPWGTQENALGTKIFCSVAPNTLHVGLLTSSAFGLVEQVEQLIVSEKRVPWRGERK